VTTAERRRRRRPDELNSSPRSKSGEIKHYPPPADTTPFPALPSGRGVSILNVNSPRNIVSIYCTRPQRPSCYYNVGHSYCIPLQHIYVNRVLRISRMRAIRHKLLGVVLYNISCECHYRKHNIYYGLVELSIMSIVL